MVRFAVPDKETSGWSLPDPERQLTNPRTVQENQGDRAALEPSVSLETCGLTNQSHNATQPCANMSPRCRDIDQWLK